MSEAVKFSCDKCGACCRFLSRDILDAVHLPVHSRGEGCAHLTDANLCAIYETRPTLCRVDRVAMIMGVSAEASMKACQMLKEKHRP